MVLSKVAPGAILALSFALGLVPATIDRADAADRTVIRIGAVVDQTGGSTSPLFRAAVELAGKQMNEALDRSGSTTKFEIVYGDSKSIPPFAQSEALRLINQDQVNAIVADSSGVAVAINRLNYDANSPAKHKVAITCFQCSSGFIHDPNVTESDLQVQTAERDLGHWLYREFYVSNYEAAALAQIALHRINAGAGKAGEPLKIGIFADGGHRALASGFQPMLSHFYKQPSVTEITYFTSLDKLQPDWDKVVKPVDANGKPVSPPDLVIVTMLPEAAAAAISAYHKAGYKIPILSNNSFRRNYILKKIAAEAEGLEGSSVMLVDKSASGALFQTAFKKMTGELPEMTSSGAYDSAVTLMLAALVASKDANKTREVSPEDIRKALGEINVASAKKIRPSVADFSAAIKLIDKGKPINYEGAYSPNDWNSVGDIFPPLVHWKVENGQFKEYEQYDCGPTTAFCPRKG
ncbi:MAG TPA: ABC transporter substrate-binding protein [Pseudolabrys sp.]|nr:ABC transporter substrate-binding protein [Pseudolabrys sp.]